MGFVISIEHKHNVQKGKSTYKEKDWLSYKIKNKFTTKNGYRDYV